MSDSYCQDFARTKRLTTRAMSGRAVAGAGLPAIEPGMPDPAGTGLSRRALLLRGAGLALSVYGGSKLGIGAFEEGIAEAAGDPSTVLVSVFLEGGIDGLSVLSPVNDPIYKQKRPSLKLPPNSSLTFAGDPTLQWHPSAKGLQQLYDAGKLLVFPSIGYEHPDQSHFTSRHYWQVGELNPHANVGWMGRWLDVYGSNSNPLQGLTLNDSLSPTVAAAAVPVAAVSTPEDYDFWTAGVWNERHDTLMRQTVSKFGVGDTSDIALFSARRAVRASDQIRTQLEDFSDDEGNANYTIPSFYPHTMNNGQPSYIPFHRRLAGLAEMIDRGLPIRCVAIDAVGSYDTHSGQSEQLTNNLKGTVDGLAAFQQDIEQRGIADRVIVKIWSEFGRRPQENGSGTDHGAAGVAFLMGTRVNANTNGNGVYNGVIGGFAGMTQVDTNGNLQKTSDFRAMYSALIAQWLGGDPAAIIPASGGELPQLIAT